MSETRGLDTVVAPDQKPPAILSSPDWFKPVEQHIRTAEGTAQGSGNVLYGGQQFTPGHDFPQWEGATGPSGQPTHAAGPGQWQPETWGIEKARAAKQGVDLDFSNPQHQGWAMFDLASRTYHDHTGRSLEADQRDGKVNYAAMSHEWEGLGSHDPAAVHHELRTAAFGGFQGDAQNFANAMIEQVHRSSERFDAEVKAAKEPRELAQALERKMLIDSQKPPQNMHENWNVWGSAAGLLALFGGLGGRRHMNAALSAAGAMFEAANDADRGTYDRAYKEWKDNRDFGMRAVEMLVRQANDIVSDATKSYDHQLTELQTLSAMYQLPDKLNHARLAEINEKLGIEEKSAELTRKQNETTEKRLAVDEMDSQWSRENGGNPVPASVHNANVGLAEHQRKGIGFGKQGETKEIEQVTPDGSAKSGAAYRVGTDWYWAGTGERVEGKFDFKSVGRPRSAPAEFIDQLKKENPHITSDEISHAAALFRADADAATGAMGKNITALNTLADHLPLFEKYARALGSGDVRVINRALQALSEETGHPEITNFEVAKEFIADEAVKTMVGSGAGALADREALKNQLMARLSQAQLGGAADVIKDFTHGKLGALRQQYGRGDPKREDYFNSHILTSDALRLFDAGEPGAQTPAASRAAPSPGDLMDGYIFKGGDPADQKNWSKAPPGAAQTR